MMMMMRSLSVQMRLWCSCLPAVEGGWGEVGACQLMNFGDICLFSFTTVET